jgi:hypothetical protein
MKVLGDYLASGGRYAPSATSLGLGAPLRPEDAVPPLYRWPGPRAMAAALRGMPGPLAPGATLWLHEDPAFTPAGRTFGVLAVLDPRPLSLVRAGDGSWVGTGISVASVWLPPPAFGVPFADEGAVRAFPGYDALLSGAVDALGAYLEEMALLEKAGVPSPVGSCGVTGAWCAVPEAERRRILADAGFAGRWTR